MKKINFIENKVSLELKRIKKELKNGVLEDIEAANSLYEFVTENKSIKNYDYIEFICYSLSCQDFLDDMEIDLAIKKTSIIVTQPTRRGCAGRKKGRYDDTV